MTIESLHVGMKVRHPQYGAGTVKTISEHTADILFDEGLRSVAPEPSGLQPAESQAEITGLTRPLSQLIDEVAAAAVRNLGLERPDAAAGQIASRWRKGVVVLRPGDPSLQSKEVPLETFFHKIVMMRNNLRVLEQKINGHAQLSDAEKVDLQEYITRCYGSMTTFNLLFREEQDQFRS